MHFCCLNITDVNKLICDKNDDLLLPTIPGCEFSGEILEVGDYVTENLKIGDKVVALLGKSKFNAQRSPNTDFCFCRT